MSPTDDNPAIGKIWVHRSEYDKLMQELLNDLNGLPIKNGMIRGEIRAVVDVYWIIKLKGKLQEMLKE